VRPSRLEDLVGGVAGGSVEPVYLIHGDLVLAEPAGERLAAALAETAGCRVVTHRRPPHLTEILDDLRTFSLFDSAKVVLAIDTAALADRRAAADLVDAAAEVLPVTGAADEPAPRDREAASRLLQALRLFDLDPRQGSPESLLEGLPAWVLQGGEAFRRGRNGRGRGKRQVEDLRKDLEALLELAQAAGLTGRGGSDLAELSVALSEGLPERHSLLLVERSVAEDHPLVETLRRRGVVLAVGAVAEGRGGWQGLERMAEEMERQTGVSMTRDGLAELARRTLRKDRERSGGPRSSTGVDAASTARLAGEYRKLAHLAQGAGRERIDRSLVEQGVEDRGQEDVFKLLDAVGAGRGDEALARLRRLLGSAEDPLAARLTFFALFASFCRPLTATTGLMRRLRVPPGARYPAFKSRWAPRLQGELDGVESPLAGIHPYALHRVYLAASNIDPRQAAKLPAWVLETELRIKGDSGEPDAALAHLVTRVAGLALDRRAR
jgi:hypothetical protein